MTDGQRKSQEKYRKTHREELRKSRKKYYRLHLKEFKFRSAWDHLHARCKERKTYFEKGIRCEWKSFEEFKRDMWSSFLRHNRKYGGQQTTIDRIDNDGNYSKKNCRWTTRKIQANNQPRKNQYSYEKSI